MVGKCFTDGCTSLGYINGRTFCYKHAPLTKDCQHAGCFTKIKYGKFCVLHKKKCSKKNCETNAISGKEVCSTHSPKKDCLKKGCTNTTQNRTYCARHTVSNKCTFVGCKKYFANGYKFCKEHGGFTVCQKKSCFTPAYSNKHRYCRLHTDKKDKYAKDNVPEGTLKKINNKKYIRGPSTWHRICNIRGCNKLGHLNSGKYRCTAHMHFCKKVKCSNKIYCRYLCIEHYKKANCVVKNCAYLAIKGYDRCTAHGGGKKCRTKDCTAKARRFGRCRQHGPKCKHKGCNSAQKINKKCYKHQPQEYKDKYNAKVRYKYKNNSIFKLNEHVRKRFHKAFTRSNQINRKFYFKKYIGLTPDKLWDYLESLFEPGMTRKNYGKWHIDHIKPVSSFDLTENEEIRKCFFYKNLQPLWALDNLRKGSKLDWKKTN